MKAAQIKATVTNINAILRSIEYQLRPMEGNVKELYAYACDLLEQSLRLEYSDESMYNLLSYRYLLNPADESLLDDVRSLLSHFESEEVVRLYMELLRAHSCVDEGEQCIAKYGKYLENSEILMFYSKCGMYEKGYEVRRNFGVDQFSASAIIECCIRTGHLEKAREYEKSIRAEWAETRYQQKEKKEWCKIIFRDDEIAAQQRRQWIDEYCAPPRYIVACSFFGCSMHGTPWLAKEMDICIEKLSSIKTGLILNLKRLKLRRPKF